MPWASSKLVLEFQSALGQSRLGSKFRMVSKPLSVLNNSIFIQDFQIFGDESSLMTLTSDWKSFWWFWKEHLFPSWIEPIHIHFVQFSTSSIANDWIPYSFPVTYSKILIENPLGQFRVVKNDQNFGNSKWSFLWDKPATVKTAVKGKYKSRHSIWKASSVIIIFWFSILQKWALDRTFHQFFTSWSLKPWGSIYWYEINWLLWNIQNSVAMNSIK